MRKHLIGLLFLIIFTGAAHAYINAAPLKGYLLNTAEVDSIKINTDETPVYAVFSWDQGLDLWVRIVGQTGDLLGDFQMAQGDTAELKGTGQFTLEVYSKDGNGNWECTMMDELEYNTLE